MAAAKKRKGSRDAKFKFLPLTADVKFQAYGATLEEAFANAAVAMFNVMVDTAKVESKVKKTIAAAGIDLQSLLQNFLEQFIILLDTENFFLSKVEKVEIKKISDSNCKLTAVAYGDEAKNYETIGPVVKACTYNDMFVRQEEEGKQAGKGTKKQWAVQVVLDI